MCPQVFSSAKYPAPEHLREYGSIFTGAQDPGLQRRPRHRIQSKHRPLDERALQVCGSALHPGGTEAPEDSDCWRSWGITLAWSQNPPPSVNSHLPTPPGEAEILPRVCEHQAGA